VETPTLIPYFENIKIKKIGCGARHSVVLDFDNNLYTFGDNSDGQSIGHNTNNWIPQLFNEGKSMKIVDFSVGNYHNFLKTRTGDIFCWGNSKDGKFGDKYNVPFNIPRNILKLKGTNVSYIALGETISIFFTTSIDNKILIERKEIKTNICINKNQ
jgi:alpha-tubulin suppressor-like RCC1 family protein